MRKLLQTLNIAYLMFEVNLIPLSRQEINSILETMKIEGLVQLGIIAFDGGDAFTPKFNTSKIEELINNCQELFLARNILIFTYFKVIEDYLWLQ